MNYNFATHNEGSLLYLRNCKYSPKGRKFVRKFVRAHWAEIEQNKGVRAEFWAE